MNHNDIYFDRDGNEYTLLSEPTWDRTRDGGQWSTTGYRDGKEYILIFRDDDGDWDGDEILEAIPA